MLTLASKLRENGLVPGTELLPMAGPLVLYVARQLQLNLLSNRIVLNPVYFYSWLE